MGRNYLAHAREFGNDLPEEPLLFLKPSSALLAPGGSIVIPPGVGRVDFEGEIGVILGRSLRNATPFEAAAGVAFVLPLNDVTARDLQSRDSQWTRAKGFDTFCPVGEPVPAEGVDLEALTVITRVNGEERQRGYSRDMAFPVPELLSYISGIMTLEVGDLVATGTPEGVGPIRAGDRVEVELPGLGLLSNPVIDQS